MEESELGGHLNPPLENSNPLLLLCHVLIVFRKVYLILVGRLVSPGIVVRTIKRCEGGRGRLRTFARKFSNIDFFPENFTIER